MNERAAAVSGAAQEAVAAERCELGRLLAGFRHRARLSQRQLARLTGYSPTVIASAETGRPYVSGKFWKLADNELNAGGQLMTAYERVRCLDVWAREQAHSDQAARQDGQPAPLPGIAIPVGGRTTTTPAIGLCPHCHQPLALVTLLAAQAPEPTANRRSRR